MDPHLVKLTVKEEALVVARFIYHLAPWRRVILIIASIIIALNNITCDYSIAGHIIFNSVMGFVVGLFANFILFDIIPPLFKEFKEYIASEYQEHKLEVQKETLDKTDDLLLK